MPVLEALNERRRKIRGGASAIPSRFEEEARLLLSFLPLFAITFELRSLLSRWISQPPTPIKVSMLHGKI
jgi:hypothetical protein